MNHPGGPPASRHARTPAESPRVVLGADVGGTSTRVGVATSTGELLAVHTAGAGNPTSLGADAAARHLAAACTTALADAGVAPDEVSAAMLGLAGWSVLRGREEEFCRQVLPDVATVRLGVDIAVAFSTAVPDRSGVVSIAGTGAGTMRVLDGTVVERRDGWGWLLGDRGSGTWLGTAAVRHALGELETRQPETDQTGTDQAGTGEPGPLTRAVLDALGTTDLVGTIAAAYREPPTRLSRLAPLVSRHADSDPAAAELADRAAAAVVATIDSLSPATDEAVVLGGSVLTQPGPVGAGVRRRLAERGLRTETLAASGPAGSGLVGALWIALGGLGRTAPEVHRQLLEQARAHA